MCARIVVGERNYFGRALIFETLTATASQGTCGTATTMKTKQSPTINSHPWELTYLIRKRADSVS